MQGAPQEAVQEHLNARMGGIPCPGVRFIIGGGLYVSAEPRLRDVGTNQNSIGKGPLLKSTVFPRH